MPATPSLPAYRYRRGDSDFTTIPTPASTAINPGDLIFSNSGVAAVANSFTWTTDLPTTQGGFRLSFLGVACDQKVATDASTAKILVQTKGIFEYPCAALGAAAHIGASVGPAKDAAGNFLMNQMLAVAPAVTNSIGTLAEEAAVGATSLMVYLQSFLIFNKVVSAT